MIYNIIIIVGEDSLIMSGICRIHSRNLNLKYGLSFHEFVSKITMSRAVRLRSVDILPAFQSKTELIPHRLGYLYV